MGLNFDYGRLKIRENPIVEQHSKRYVQVRDDAVVLKTALAKRRRVYDLYIRIHQNFHKHNDGHLLHLHLKFSVLIFNYQIAIISDTFES